MSLVVYLAVVTALIEPLCSIKVGFDGPTIDQAIVLAVASAETVQVTGQSTLDRARTIPDSTVPVRGYRFRVIQAAGGANRIRSGDSFIAVPWEYNTACDPMIWSADHWVPAGAEVVFTLSTNRMRSTAEVVVDVFGWHAPYPHGQFLKYRRHAQPPADRAQWLSAREYFSLASLLPVAAKFQSDREWLAQIERVFAEGNPRWKSAFPGTEILESARRQASGKRAF